MDDLWTARRERARRFLATPPTHRQAWASKTYHYDTAEASQEARTGGLTTEDDRTDGRIGRMAHSALENDNATTTHRP